MRYVQSSVSMIGFPKKLDELESFYYEGWTPGWATDLDLLLGATAREDPDILWTAPRWMTENDILFMYHTKSAGRSVRRLLAQALSLAENLNSNVPSQEPTVTEQDRRCLQELVRLLERAAVQFKTYSGTIFGCAEISGAAEYLADDGVERHYSGRSSVPLGKVHIFEHPLPPEELAGILRIEQSTPNTPLYKEQFDSIKQRLAEHNRLPEFLCEARIGDKTFRDVNGQNWPSISCDPGARFVNEAQLRAYFLDFLLDEVKDPKTPLLQECWCYRNGSKTGGRADYFVRVHGVWIPVEAKLNVLTEKNLLGQTAKYTYTTAFEPTVGPHRGDTYHATISPVCLIADQSGLYIVADGDFSGCSLGNPVWRRDKIDHALTSIIRDRVARILNSSNIS